MNRNSKLPQIYIFEKHTQKSKKEDLTGTSTDRLLCL